MCGILGLYPFKQKDNSLDQQVKTFIQRWLFVETMNTLEKRGHDASGVALLWKDSKSAVIKQPVTASFFVINDGNVKDEYKDPEDERATFSWIMKKWSERLTTADIAQVLGHVRAKTKGTELVPENNHPIIINDQGSKVISDNTIIGVHNGTIRNDDDITKKHGFKRLGEVDSEVIFQLLNEYKDNLDLDTLTKVYDELSGFFAVLAYNTSKPNMVYGIREDRPIEFGYIRDIGTLIAVSEKDFLKDTITPYEHWRIREDAENKFPYIDIEWLKTIDTGVFTIDLDTEVDETTKVESLINFKKLKKSVANTYTEYTPTKTPYNATTPPAVPTLPATTPTSASATPAAATPPVVDKRSAIVHDLSDYSSETSEADVPNKETAGVITVSEDEGAGVEIEITNEGDDSVEDDTDGTDYTYVECIAMGSEFFSSNVMSGNNVDPDMFFYKATEEQRELLSSKYGIKIKDDTDVANIVSFMYDIIFPEGFAYGFSDGYNTASDDSSESELKKEVTKLQNKIIEQREQINKMFALASKWKKSAENYKKAAK